MTLAEFLSLGIQREKKYKVKLRLNSRQEPKEYELFFWGFRFYAVNYPRINSWACNRPEVQTGAALPPSAALRRGVTSWDD